MDRIQNGWFSELSELWPGQALSLEVDKVLFKQKSKYQDIMVFKSKNYGNVLVLDGVIQCTERDEFSYQEMIAHLPLFSHPHPRRVLVIGGGDGGVVREILKHSQVEQIDMCEIDEMVIEVSKQLLPNMACGFSDPRLRLHVKDGVHFMEEHKATFDVIITDSSDPIGPACSLFEERYYQLMKEALAPGGVICSQGESLWLHLELIGSMQQFCRSLFPSVAYAFTTIPTYPSGQIGFLLCSPDPSVNFAEPRRVLSAGERSQMALRYYNPDIHRAAFCLPEFARKSIQTS
ncbi:spermidine synthase-like isoform X2 [Babylonia areolata]|uniref:spermidine synthase-like isoform X1 n=1 Tax=Babylonia areolata TaxID=304850 RepID=UPI003FCFDBF1